MLLFNQFKYFISIINDIKIINLFKVLIFGYTNNITAKEVFGNEKL